MLCKAANEVEALGTLTYKEITPGRRKHIKDRVCVWQIQAPLQSARTRNYEHEIANTCCKGARVYSGRFIVHYP